MNYYASSGAVFSKCGTWRYHLWRTWGAGPIPLYILLNPSKAGAANDDSTVSRLAVRSRSLGCGGFELVNAFAFCSTFPSDLWRALDPVGPENDAWIANAISYAPSVIVGWGKDGRRLLRDQKILRMIHDAGIFPLCLKRNGDGTPCHPLYLPYSLRPRELANQ